MKTFAMLLAATALAACSSEPAEEAVETPAATETAAAGDLTGTYEVTRPDGTGMTVAVKADGTYTESAGGKVLEEGTWSQTDGKSCFTPTEDPENRVFCYANSAPSADGTFTLTPDEGEALTVKKVG